VVRYRSRRSADTELRTRLRELANERRRFGYRRLADSSTVAKPTHRSRVTNGAALLPSVDGRSIWARLMRDTMAAMFAHCGGENRVSEAKRLAIRRIAALEAELIFLEDKFARTRGEGGEPDAADLDLYGRLANGQRRHLEAVGWDRTQRDVTPSLAAYAAQTAGSSQ
jgi:hypothetical protein